MDGRLEYRIYTDSKGLESIRSRFEIPESFQIRHLHASHYSAIEPSNREKYLDSGRFGFGLDEKYLARFGLQDSNTE